MKPPISILEQVRRDAVAEASRTWRYLEREEAFEEGRQRGYKDAKPCRFCWWAFGASVGALTVALVMSALSG